MFALNDTAHVIGEGPPELIMEAAEICPSVAITVIDDGDRRAGLPLGASRTRTPAAIARARGCAGRWALAGLRRRQRRGEAETTTVATSGARPRASPGEQLGRTPAIADSAVTDPGRRAYIARIDGDLQQARPRAQLGAASRSASRPIRSEAAQAYDDTIALGERQLREIEAIPAPPGDLQLLRTNVFDALKQPARVLRARSAPPLPQRMCRGCRPCASSSTTSPSRCSASPAATASGSAERTEDR